MTNSLSTNRCASRISGVSQHMPHNEAKSSNTLFPLSYWINTSLLNSWLYRLYTHGWDARRVGSVWAVSQLDGICDSYCGQWVCPSSPLRSQYSHRASTYTLWQPWYSEGCKEYWLLRYMILFVNNIDVQISINSDEVPGARDRYGSVVSSRSSPAKKRCYKISATIYQAWQSSLSGKRAPPEL